MLQLKKVQISRITALLLMAVALCLNLAAVPAKPAPPKTAHVPAKIKAALVNPHLHNAKAAVAKSTINTKLAKHWQHRWSFADWAVVHRGTGTVMGQVHTASGIPVAGAGVVLRTSKGGAFRNVALKHITHTNAAGSFIMRHVRIGSYRVRSSKGKAAGHVGIRLHGGGTVMAMVKL